MLLFGFAFIQEAFVRAFFDTEEKTWTRFAKRTRHVGAISAIGFSRCSECAKERERVYSRFLCVSVLVRDFVVGVYADVSDV